MSHPPADTISTAQRVNVFIDHEDELLVAGIEATLGVRMAMAHEPGEADVIVAGYVQGMQLAKSAPRLCSRLLVLTHVDTEVQIRAALGCGIRGYLLSPCSARELRDAVSGVHSGRQVISPVAAGRLAQSLVHRSLTARQADVLRCLMSGYSNKQIAKELGVTEGTVKSHLKTIMRKLGATSRLQAIRFAQHRGLFNEDLRRCKVSG